MKKKLLVFLLFLMMIVMVSCNKGDVENLEKIDTTTRNIFVSPTGTETGDGSEENPFSSITAARDYVNTIKDSESKNIKVYLRGGMYELDETLVFTAEDNAPDGKTITYINYPNEKPVISGGKTITGWRFADGKYYAKIGSGLNIRNFYIDGERRERAGKIPTGINKGSSCFEISPTGPFANLALYENLKEVEIVTECLWKIFRVKINSVSDGKIYIDNEILNNASATGAYGLFSTNSRIVRIENAYELLTEKGQWYYNKSTGIIYYIPFDDEKMGGKLTVVGLQEGLMKLDGDLDNKVKNINFEGLTFSYDAWNGMDRTAYLEHQAGGIQTGPDWFDIEKTPGGVIVESCENVSFKRNTFTHMGINGISVIEGSKHVSIDSNVFRDISGAAVTIADIRGADPRVIDNETFSDHHPDDENRIVEHISVNNNYITDIGVEYWGNPGIVVSYARNISVTHNTLHNLPYSGISLGWGWGYPDENYTSVCENNVIKGNKIYNYMNKLNDGGGIYTLGAQRNSVITENFLAVHNNDYAYIYLDNGSEGFTISKNVVSNFYDGKNGYCLNWILISTHMTEPEALIARDNVLENNWYSSSLTKFMSSVWSQYNNIDRNNVGVENEKWPEEAEEIIKNAGSTLKG